MITLTNRDLAVVTAARLALTVAFRLVYPLLPLLTTRFAIDLTTAAAIVTTQLIMSISSPIFGRLADTHGERPLMLVGLALFTGGATLCAIAPVFGVFLVGYAVIGLAMSCYLPAAQSYLSRRAPYERRAQVLGIFETVWAAAAVLGVFPLLALLDRTGELWPIYAILATSGALSFALVAWLLPGGRGGSSAAGDAGIMALRNRSVGALLIFVILTYSAYELVLTPQSTWLAQVFAADAARLGQLAAVSGVAEFVGSLAVIGFVDRVGKRRAVAISYAAAALLMAALPLTAGNWLLFLPVFALLYVALEFAIVATITLTSTVAPQARGTMMAIKIVIASSSRALAAALASGLWLRVGYANVGLIAGVLILVALAALPYVRDAEAQRGAAETPVVA